MSIVQPKHCLPCEGIGSPLTQEEVNQKIKDLSEGWTISKDLKMISKDFQFKNFYQTMGFVNAIAWMANLENHHPDLEVGYKHCLVHYSTHAIHGLSINDFICATQIDLIYQPYTEKYYERK